MSTVENPPESGGSSRRATSTAISPPGSLRAQVRTLPPQPGVYLFRDGAGEILYVGKATSLRERVRSYLAKEIGRGPAIEKMVHEAKSVTYQTTDSEIAALILEAQLIRKHKPPYNIRLRDDKSFALIRIDLSERFPGVYVAREKDLETLLAQKQRVRSQSIAQRIAQQEFYGPYLSTLAVRRALRALRRVWPFRDCSGAKASTAFTRHRPCLQASLGLCAAPCVWGADPTLTDARMAPKLLALTEEELATRTQEYRVLIDQLRAFLKGEHRRVVQQIEKEMALAATREEFERAAYLRDRLNGLKHLQLMADVNRAADVERPAVELRYNPETDLRVECFDISNNQGTSAVGSLVSGILVDGKATVTATREDARDRLQLDRTRYRRFKVKTVQGASDVAMLAEILQRRFGRATTWPLPDLILVDGGAAQFRVASEARDRFCADHPELNRGEGGDSEHLLERPIVRVASVAKGPTRRAVDRYGEEWHAFPLVAPLAWQQIAERLREEAHRFAIAYYRKVHRKQLLNSSRPV